MCESRFVLLLQNDLEGNEKLSQAWEIARLRSVTWFEEYVSCHTQLEFGLFYTLWVMDT